jgi:hypothetical protein
MMVPLDILPKQTKIGWWFQTWILFSISYMGCHPSHWRTPSFFKMGTLHHQPVPVLNRHHRFKS